MKNGLLLLSLISFLSACTPPLTHDQKLAIFRSRCVDYGYQNGTVEFAECMMKQEDRDERNALQLRNIEALERRNWLEQEIYREEERKRHEKHKTKKIEKKLKKNFPF